MLRWRGDEVRRAVMAAARGGIDETMARAVVEAKRRVPVLTGTLQGSLQMRPARERGGGVVGLWGSFSVQYAVYVEMGTGRMGARPYLRPAADQEYPGLAGRIQRRL